MSLGDTPRIQDLAIVWKFMFFILIPELGIPSPYGI